MAGYSMTKELKVYMAKGKFFLTNEIGKTR